MFSKNPLRNKSYQIMENNKTVAPHIPYNNVSKPSHSREGVGKLAYARFCIALELRVISTHGGGAGGEQTESL